MIPGETPVARGGPMRGYGERDPSRAESHFQVIGTIQGAPVIIQPTTRIINPAPTRNSLPNTEAVRSAGRPERAQRRTTFPPCQFLIAMRRNVGRRCSRRHGGHPARASAPLAPSCCAATPSPGANPSRITERMLGRQWVGNVSRCRCHSCRALCHRVRQGHPK